VFSDKLANTARKSSKRRSKVNKQDIFWDSFALGTLALALIGLLSIIGCLTGLVQVML
jgi:hypothetical protein